MKLELVQPELLLLILLLAVLWILRPLWSPGSMPAKIVPSTLLWHRAIPLPRGKRTLLPLLVTFALIFVAAGPRLILDEDSPVVVHRTIDGTLLIDIQGPEDAKVEIRSAQQAPRSYFLSSAGEAVIEEQDLSPGTPIEVSVASSKLILAAPPQLKKPVVLDRSELIEVSVALQALVKANRIVVSNSQPDVIIAREIAAESSVPTILFPAEEGSRILPRARIAGASPQLLDGLHPRYWTVLRAKQISGDAILVDQEDHALLSRTAEGFRWGFLPGSGDLASRSDWPVLLGRLIEELATPQLTSSDLAFPTGSVSFLASLSGAGVHLSLILAILMVVITPVVLGSRGQIPALCILFAIIIGQIPAASVVLPPQIDLEQFSAEHPPGTSVLISSSTAPPSPDLVRRIQSRGIEMRIENSSARSWKVEPARIRWGQEARIKGSQESDSFGAITPTGDEIEIASSWTPAIPGAWLIERTAADIDTLIVEPPIPAALWSAPGFAAENLLPTNVFARTETIDRFPEPAAGSVIVWNSVPIEETQFGALKDWMSRGGTFLALPADPFCNDEATRQRLTEILPGPIPAPPRPPLQDLGILLLDLSGSLTGDAATTLLAAAISILEASPQQSRWGIAGFRDQPAWIFPPGTTIDRSVLENLNQQIETGGGTNLGAAIRFCHEGLRNGNGGKSLVVITDGRSTPDDWNSIGKNLRKNDIDLDILLVGTNTELDAVEALLDVASGTLHSATSPQHARALLREVIEPPEEGWQPVRPPVQVGSLDPFLEAGPTRPPNPVRRIAIQSPSPAPDSKNLWVDDLGEPILSMRSHGEGLAALWHSGLDEFSLGNVSEKTLSHLSQLLAASADRREEPRRRGFLVQGLGGEQQLALKRRAGDSLSFEIALGRIGHPAVPIRTRTTPGTSWSLATIPQELQGSAVWWGQGRASDAGQLPARGNLRRWKSIVGRLSEAKQRPRPAENLLLFLAAMLLLSNRANRWSDLLPRREKAPAMDRHR